MTDKKLVKLCQARIQSGALPESIRVTTLGGYSAGSSCAACGQSIATNATELQLEWLNGGKPQQAQVHPTCYDAWAEAVRAHVRDSMDVQDTS